MLGLKIALTGVVVFFLILLIDMANKGIPRFWRIIGGIAIVAVPIGLLIQIWQ